MKKFMKKLLKKAEGFTLVELIVVIAILGVLAGVAVPAYSGYLKKANETADTTALSAVKTAVQAAYAQEAAMPTSIVVTDAATDKITIGGTEFTSSNELYDDFMLYYTNNAAGTFSISLKTGNTATWSGDKWVISGTAYNPS